MQHITVRIRIPGGQEKLVRVERSNDPRSLAEALEAAGVPLNMRCGGRGLCMGCKVEIGDGQNFETFRACQRHLSSMPQEIDWIRVPGNSWRDHSLHGVSVFEIGSQVRHEPLSGEGCGIALDVGTTTLAGALWDLSTGQCLAHLSRSNPQARYGDNVVSRIHYAIENTDGSSSLKKVLVKDGLLPLTRELCRLAGREMRSISRAAISGNPTMLHTLIGEPLDGLARYPFSPAFIGERKARSSDLGFPFEFTVQLLPGLGPFVGADIVCGAFASGMLQDEGPFLLIDFGTNGEILLRHGDRFFATATAAGPAFEGGRLRCGCPARDGVISSIGRCRNKWTWKLCGEKTVEPSGISGAAYIDFIANGTLCGLLDRFGRFDRNSPEVIQIGDKNDPEWAIRISGNTLITEADVAELLQAKAAIGGGVMTILQQAGVHPLDLKRIFVAGGFGYHLNPLHARAIGLLPDIPVESIHMIGNASLGGASLLLNEKNMDQVKPLLNECAVIELNQIESFEDNFTDCLEIVKFP